ncbi:MAG: tetraprenyl-beta-curcumene synthase family protein, partial [Gemmatimonadota bacterium]|nr:tetraprenyl-beta-curcumene synthase family protein [Gemmatimonadota bacterium]
EEGLNAEGAALFAMLAPVARRRAATRLLVAFQVMYDYLDALTERPAPEPLRGSRQLHRALLAALGAPAPADGYFAHYALADGDGGYLTELIACCRAIFHELPGAVEATPYAMRAAARSAEGQSHSHAAAFAPEHELIRWAERETPAGLDLRWWETAAAAESSLLIHALLASAAGRHFSATRATNIAAAYWPWITGLNALLDDLIDTAEDAAEGTHSYVGRYHSPAQTARRLAAIAAEASDAIAQLPLRRRHRVIFAAMTSYYLAAPQAADTTIAPVARMVAEQMGMDLRPLLAMIRLRRRLA